MGRAVCNSDNMKKFEVRYGNRAVKARLEVEAESAAEARTKAQAFLEESYGEGHLIEDCRILRVTEIQHT